MPLFLFHVNDWRNHHLNLQTGSKTSLAPWYVQDRETVRHFSTCQERNLTGTWHFCRRRCQVFSTRKPGSLCMAMSPLRSIWHSVSHADFALGSTKWWSLSWQPPEETFWAHTWSSSWSCRSLPAPSPNLMVNDTRKSGLVLGSAWQVQIH